MNVRYFVQVVDLNTGEMFSLPTLYTDRTEACVCGQNYIRDCQAEDKFSLLFFRVLISYDNNVAEPIYFTRVRIDEDKSNSEESNFYKLMESIFEVCQDYGADLRIHKV